MIRKGFVLLLLAGFVLLLVLANNISAPTPTTPWYEVEEWEKEVCSKWGGTRFAGQEAVTTGRKFSWAAMTATVQGKKLKTPENYYLYEVGWYIDSFSETTDYDIVLVNPVKKDLKHKVASGSLSPDSGTVGHEVFNLTQDYTHITLLYSGGTVTTPIIQVR